ncbi:hypothetical protein [Streptomyces sp. NPDC001889]
MSWVQARTAVVEPMPSSRTQARVPRSTEVEVASHWWERVPMR